MKLTANRASGPCSLHYRGRRYGAKLLRVMKLTTVLMLAFCLHTSAKGVAQQTITFSGREVSLENVFNAIKKQTNYRFFFNTDAIQHAGKVTIEVKNANIEQVMNLALKDQPLTFAIKGRTIFIMKKPEEEKSSLNVVMSGDPVTVSGKVTDDKGRPLAGANVKVKGSSTGVTTDNQGRFTLNNVDPDATLEISFVGHETKNLPVKGKTILVVALGQKVSTLDETVVIAYGTTTKRLSTGNVSTVKGSDIEKQPVQNPLLALQGRVPGMIITQKNGVPGGQIDIQIRGRNSITQSTDPLYIIDGVPYTSQLFVSSNNLQGLGVYVTGGANPFSFLNPLDIASIDVLKDADATAIYGSRGANGVVLITTKKGKVGEMKVDMNFQSGTGSVTRKAKLMNTEQYLEMRKEAFVNDAATPSSTDFDVNGTWSENSYTNWQDVMIGGHSHYTDGQVSISGGNLNTQYRLGTGYHHETTVFPGNWNDQKLSMNLSINSTSSNQRFKMMFSGSFISDNNKLPTTDFTKYILLAPNAPWLYDLDGSLDWVNYFENPFANKLNTYNIQTNNLISNSTFSYNIFSGFDIKASIGYTNIQLNERTATPSTYWNSTYNVKTGSASFNQNSVKSWIFEPQLVYQIKINKTKVNALAGFTIQQRKNDGQIVKGDGYTNDALLESLAAAASISNVGSIFERYKYTSIFGRINYNYNEKYLFNLTARRDGSSRFGPGKQFGNFGSIGIGWIFSSETFIQKAIPFLSFGKLRGSYGASGNEPGDNYKYLELYNFTGNNPYQGGTGLSPQNLPNPNFSWEINRKMEVGLELGFFNDRILFTSSFYKNRCSNQLVSYTLPSIAGIQTVLANLPAKIQNAGLEIILNTSNIKSKKISWSTGFNISIEKNKLIDFPNIENTPYSQAFTIGKPITTAKVYRFANVDPTTGMYQFYDKDGNLTFTPDQQLDRIDLINIAPKFYGGINNSFQFKGFQIDILFQFVRQIGRNYLFQDSRSPGLFSFYDIGGNQPVELLDRWQKTGSNAKYQKFSQDYSLYSAYSDYAQSSTIAYSDASFLRLKNISVSYQLVRKWVEKIHSDNARIYIQAQNLLTVSKYKGVDPENQSLTSLPPLRIITAGVLVSL